MGNNQQGICPGCFEEGVLTKEHFPPKCVFNHPFIKDTRTRQYSYPLCISCNHKFHQFDQKWKFLLSTNHNSGLDICRFGTLEDLGLNGEPALISEVVSSKVTPFLQHLSLDGKIGPFSENLFRYYLYLSHSCTPINDATVFDITLLLVGWWNEILRSCETIIWSPKGSCLEVSYSSEVIRVSIYMNPSRGFREGCHIYYAREQSSPEFELLRDDLISAMKNTRMGNRGIYLLIGDLASSVRLTGRFNFLDGLSRVYHGVPRSLNVVKVQDGFLHSVLFPKRNKEKP